MTTTEITARVDRKERALKAAAEVTEDLAAAKAELETLKYHYTREGLEGTNDKLRQADLLAKTEPEREAVAEAERALRAAQLELDLASLRVQEALMLTRLPGNGP